MNSSAEESTLFPESTGSGAAFNFMALLKNVDLNASRRFRLCSRCGGCPAVTQGAGLNPLVDRDTHCFLPA